jgi:class 3 adenylate cyclase
MVGNVGTSQRLEYTAVGDAVNVAARLQELAGPGEILVSEATRDMLPAGFPSAGIAVRTFAVKGRELPVRAYSI